MTRAGEAGRARGWVSAFVLIVLALHAVPVAREFTGARETLWPFLAWGMYRHSSEPPVRATTHRVFAVTESGTRRVRTADAGFERFAFRRQYQVPIATGDSAAARELAGLLTRRWGTEIHAIVGEEVFSTLAEDGVRSHGLVRRFEIGVP
jgi:hypothetical protein